MNAFDKWNSADIAQHMQDSVLPETDEERHQRMKGVADLARRMGSDESSGPWRYPPQKPTPAPSVPVMVFAIALCLVMAALMVWGRM